MELHAMILIFISYNKTLRGTLVSTARPPVVKDMFKLTHRSPEEDMEQVLSEMCAKPPGTALGRCVASLPCLARQ